MTAPVEDAVLTLPAWSARAAALLRAGTCALWLVDVDRGAAEQVPAVLARCAGGGPVGRVGHTQFVVLQVAAGAAAARRAADAARAAVHRVEARDPRAARPAGATVSIGVAPAAGPGADLADLLWVADGALYAAKRAGGDATVVA